ncbi:transcriptional regulator [Fibrobacteres bacterium R8-0-B4]
MFDVSKKILWVDDEIEFFRSHVVFLETRGYSVTTAADGETAVRLVEENPAAYDLVLLDKQMPVKSGNATLDEIKAIRPNLPVVMLTGYQHSAEIAMGKRYEAYLTKPIDPGKLLIACQQILDAGHGASRKKLADRYLRGYTDMSARAAGVLGASEWMGLYHSLVKWDIELDGVASDAVSRMHTGLKSDCGKKFCDYAAENYTNWVRGGSDRPLMHVDVLEKVVAPELALGRGVLMIVLNGMRLDQFLCMEPELRRNFSVSGMKLMSLLPTLSNFCVTALAAGHYPDEAAAAEPEIFEGASFDPVAMKRLMRRGLERSGAAKVKTLFASADGPNGRRHVRSAIEAMKKAQTFGVVAVDIIEKVLGTEPAKHTKTTVTDEAEFRRRVELEFAGSTVLGVMKEVCGDDCTVILTSGHGHVICRRASEVYETANKLGPNPRCFFGNKASVDDREVFLFEDLSHLRLPPTISGKICLLARENFYLALNESAGPPSNVFQSGGVSPEEMVVPLYVCRPLAGTAR